MSADAAFRRVLEDGDFRALRRLHNTLLGHLPAPRNDSEAEISLHMARTQADWLNFKARAYSHRWLVERGLPSQLPDHLRPSAEQVVPVIKEAVLVSANTNSELLKPVMPHVQQAMCDAVKEAAADGRLSDSEFVRARMLDAKARKFKELLGTSDVGRIR